MGDSHGDAIVVRYGQGNGFDLQIVDAGYEQTGEEMVDHIQKHYGQNVIIADMVVSHADNDHAKGLIRYFRISRSTIFG